MAGARRAWAWLVRVDHPDAEVRRRGETGIVAMIVVGAFAALAVPLFALLPKPVISIAAVLAPMPFVLVFVAWARRSASAWCCSRRSCRSRC